jgi:hypothetical protein
VDALILVISADDLSAGSGAGGLCLENKNLLKPGKYGRMQL